MGHTFCPLPWKHLSTQANGDIRVCCQCVSAPYGKAKKQDGSFYNGTRDNDREVRNTSIFKEIRSQMLKGERPSHCKLCWSDEDLGKPSRRQDELRLLDPGFEEKARALTANDGSIDTDEMPVEHFDLRLGNTCNFKCRSCSPSDSSSWYDDYAKIKIEDSFFRKSPPKFNGRYPFVKSEKGWKLDTDTFNWHEDSELLRSIEKNLSHVKRIYFTGGEPTLIKAHWKLLEKIVEEGFAKDIWLDYNTNASNIRPEWISIWSKFKNVFLGCSIDGIGAKASYIRPPVEWEVIEANLQRISEGGPNIYGGFCVTVSIYNVFHYLEILDYIWEKNLTNFSPIPFGQVLETPSYLSIQALPLSVKQFVRKRYNEFLREKSSQLSPQTFLETKSRLEYILSYMDARDRSHELRTFFRKTEQLDRLRNQSFRNTFPELAEMLLKS